MWVCAAAAHAQSFTVEWTGERLTVAASGAPLPAVLTEVGRQASIRFVGLDRITGTLNADVKSALLLDALETLLADVNYVMAQPGSASQPDARLVIWLHPRTSGEAATGSGAEKVEEAPRATPSISLADDDPDGRAALLEKVRATDLSAWLDAANAEDPRARVQALERLAAQDQYETLTSQILENALEDSDSSVRDQAFVLLTVHDGPEEVLARIDALLAHPNPIVRLTAVSALRARSGDDVRRLLDRALEDENLAVRVTAEELLRVPVVK